MKIKTAVGIAAGTFFVVAAYGTSFLFARPQKFVVNNRTRQETFDKISEQYDRKTNFQELLLGITYYRKHLLRQYAYGDVLEVGAGTGKNLGLFDYEKIASIVCCDRSKQMLSIMEKKYHEIKNSSNIKRPHTFQSIDSEDLPFDDSTFDTVVDMFGLCSYDDPIQALREMCRVCKPEGKILLLEHGKGEQGWLNNYIDKMAPSHALQWGCWWNRDIRRIIRMSGIKCTIEKDMHFGTTQMRICGPNMKH